MPLQIQNNNNRNKIQKSLQDKRKVEKMNILDKVFGKCKERRHFLTREIYKKKGKRYIYKRGRPKRIREIKVKDYLKKMR